MNNMAEENENQGTLLKEWSLLSHITRLIPVKIRRGLIIQDVCFTCIDVANEFISLGTNVGIIFWFNRKTNDFVQLKPEKGELAITCIKVVSSVDYMLAAGDKQGILSIFKIPKELPKDVPEEFLKRYDNKTEVYTVSAMHKTQITALEWSLNGEKLFSGDSEGVVCFTQVDYYMNLTKSSEILNEKFCILQLSFNNNQILVVSSLYRSVIVLKNENWKICQIGTKDRKTLSELGAVFNIKSSVSKNSPVIYAARNGQRIWIADCEGVVQRTLLFKEALSNSNLNRIKLLNDKPHHEGILNCKNFEFSTLLMFQDKYVVSHSSNLLIVIHPEDMQVVTVYRSYDTIHHVAIHKEDIFIIEGNRTIRRFSNQPDLYCTYRQGKLLDTEIPPQISDAVNDIACKLRDAANVIVPLIKDYAEASPISQVNSSEVDYEANIADEIVELNSTSSYKSDEPTISDDNKNIILNITQPEIAEITLIPEKKPMDSPPPIVLSSGQKEIQQKTRRAVLQALGNKDFSDVVFSSNRKMRKTNKRCAKKRPSTMNSTSMILSREVNINNGELDSDTGSTMSEVDSVCTSNAMTVSQTSSDLDFPKFDGVIPATSTSSTVTNEELESQVAKILSLEDVIINPPPLKVNPNVLEEDGDSDENSATGRLKLNFLNSVSSTQSNTSNTSSTVDLSEDNNSIKNVSGNDEVIQPDSNESVDTEFEIILNFHEEHFGDEKDKQKFNNINSELINVSNSKKSQSNSKIQNSGSQNVLNNKSLSPTKVKDTINELASEIMIHRDANNSERNIKNIEKGLKSQFNKTIVKSISNYELSKENNNHRIVNSYSNDSINRNILSSNFVNKDTFNRLTTSHSESSSSKQRNSNGSDNNRNTSKITFKLSENDIVTIPVNEDETSEITYHSGLSDQTWEPTKSEVTNSHCDSVPDTHSFNSSNLNKSMVTNDSNHLLNCTNNKKGDHKVKSQFEKMHIDCKPNDLNKNHENTGLDVENNKKCKVSLNNLPDLLNCVDEKSNCDNQNNNGCDNTESERDDYLSTLGEGWQCCITPYTCVWFSISSDNLYCGGPRLSMYEATLHKKTLDWKLMHYKASYLFVSPSNKFLWKSNLGVVSSFVSKTSNTNDSPDVWTVCGRDVESIALNDTVAWYVYQDKVYIQALPHADPMLVPCSLNITKVVCFHNLTWVLSEHGQILSRENISSENHLGTEWRKISAPSGRHISDIALTMGNIGWIVDKFNNIFFYPENSKEWWQLLIHGNFKHETLHTQSAQKLCICSNANSIWITHPLANAVYVNKSSLYGHQWIPLALESLDLGCAKWKKLTAEGLFEDDGFLWMLSSQGDLYNYCAYDKEIQLVTSPIKPNEEDSIVSLEASPNALWVLTEKSNIYMRLGISTLNKKGVAWKKLNLEQLQCHNIQIQDFSCSNDIVWACSKRGEMFMCVCSPHEDREEIPAWISADGCALSNCYFTKVYVGLDGTMVWAIDNKNNVYVREGIFHDYQLGVNWLYVPGILASHLTISNSSVWALSWDNCVYKRVGLSQYNFIGDYWQQIPEKLSALSTSLDGNLYGVSVASGSLLKHKGIHFDLSNSRSKKAQRTSSSSDWQLVQHDWVEETQIKNRITINSEILS